MPNIIISLIIALALGVAGGSTLVYLTTETACADNAAENKSMDKEIINMRKRLGQP